PDTSSRKLVGGEGEAPQHRVDGDVAPPGDVPPATEVRRDDGLGRYRRVRVLAGPALRPDCQALPNAVVPPRVVEESSPPDPISGHLFSEAGWGRRRSAPAPGRRRRGPAGGRTASH